MYLDPQRVYLYRVPQDRDVVPVAEYEQLAYAAMCRLDFELPATGSIAFKPNITIPATPDSRIITHPGFVVGMIRRLLEVGVDAERIVVMEGYGRRPHTHPPGQHHHRHHQSMHVPRHQRRQDLRVPPGSLPEVSGYDAALAPLGLELTDHDQSDGVVVSVPGAVVFPELRITHFAAQAAFLFSVPVAKCHNLSCTTLNTKNLQGLVMSPQRHMCSVQAEDEHLPPEQLPRLTDSGLSLHEERFCHKHADLLVAVRQTGVPRLCVVDGMVGRDGTAFNEGRNWPLGWTLIGVNEVHVDAVATYLFGLDPEKTPYLRVAAQRGLGTNRVRDLEVVDLATGASLDARALEAHRHVPALMPVSRHEGGYYARFRADGSVVPWSLDRVNQQRQADGLEPIAAA